MTNSIFISIRSAPFNSGFNRNLAGIDNLGAAVAMLEGEPFVKGVVRFVQINDNTCVVDGTIDGLSPGVHGLCIHEYGDISEGCARYFKFVCYYA